MSMEWPEKQVLDEDRFDLTLNPWLEAAESNVDTLDGRVGAAESGVASLEAHNPEAWINFRNKPDGAIPTALDSGQALSITGQPLLVQSGKLHVTSAPPGTINWAGYFTAHLDAPISRAGATFCFTGGSTNGGAMAFLVPTGNYVTGIDVAGHIVMNRDSIVYQVRTAPAGFVTVYQRPFRSALPNDGTPLTCDITINGDTATIVCPDGEVATVTDPAIAANNHGYITWEPYLYATDTDNDIEILEVWADSAPATRRVAYPHADQLRAIADTKQTPITVTRYAPGTESVISLVAGRTELHADLRQRIVIPPSGRVLIELTAWIEATSAQVALGVSQNADLNDGIFIRAIDGTSSPMAYTMAETISFPPYSVVVFRAWARLQGGTSARLRMWSSGRPAILKVTPL